MKSIIRLVAIVLIVGILAVPVSAAAKSSPVNPGAPTVVPTETKPAATTKPTIVAPVEEEKEAPVEVSVGAVLDENGESVGELESTSIVVTPMVEAEEAAPEVQKELEAAYDSVETAGSVAKAAPKLETVLAVMESEVKAEDMVMRDVFHVTLDEKAQEIFTEGRQAELTFDLKVEENAVVVVLRYVSVKSLSDKMVEDLIEKGLLDEEDLEAEDDEKIWLPVDPELITINEDGTVTVKLEAIDGEIGTIGIATEKLED